MLKTRRFLLVVVVMAGSVALAAPSYLNQMTWTRGASGSTYQDWTFSTDENPATPEAFHNPYGDPTATFNGVSGLPPFGWASTWDGQVGVWRAAELSADFFIPNNPDTGNPYKVIWFEMVYQGFFRNENEVPQVIVDADFGVTEFHQSQSTFDVEVGEASYEWKRLVIGWEVYPNPISENIQFTVIGTGGFVSSVSIDTICVVPAPAALPLTALGLFMVRYLRRRITL